MYMFGEGTATLILTREIADALELFYLLDRVVN